MPPSVVKITNVDVSDEHDESRSGGAGARGGASLGGGSDGGDVEENDIDALVKAIETATGLGSTAAVAEVSESVGQSVSVRKGETETIEFSRDKYLGITVYIGKKTGHASTSDLSPAAVSQAVEAAYTLAKFTQEDAFAGLPDKTTLAKEIENLDLFHPKDISIAD